MKSFKVTSLLLLFVTLVQISFAVVPTSFQPVTVQPAENSNLVKATRLNGEWIPVVDLPLIEITALKMNSVVVGAVPVNNQIRICANLPVVEITASPITPGLVKTSYRNGEQVIMADLPVIEVVSDFPENNLITLAPQVNMPVVTLPEITVSAAPKGLLAVAVETPSGTINPLVNLPEVTISHGGGSGTGGFPYYYSGSSRWAYFIAEHGSRLIERILRSIIF